MKFRLTALMACAVLALVTTTALAVGSDPFQGHWVGIDGFDGSLNTLTVGGGNIHAVYRESGITACKPLASGELVSGSAAGFATIDGNSLEFVATLYCELESGLTAHPGFTDFTWVVLYDPATDSVSLEADPYTDMFRPAG